MGVCFLFPGQGAQYAGMGRDLYDSFAAVRELYELASESIDRDCVKLAFESTDEELKETEVTQIVITLMNMATATALGSEGVESAGCAGFSVGEIAALWDAGVFDSATAIKVAVARGRMMAHASREYGSGEHAPGMAAVLGIDIETATEVLARLSDSEVYLANHTSPSQVVVAGPSAGLERADELFEEAGAMKYVRLKVSGAFHSPLMEEARKNLEEFVKSVQFDDPRKTFVSNSTGEEPESAGEAKHNFVQQVVAPVKWVASEERLLEKQFENYLETGPGSVLTGLWKSFYKKQKCIPVGTVSELRSALDSIGN